MYIRGAECVNRAVDGDIVAFELLPEAEWFSQDGMPGEPGKEEVGAPNTWFKLSTCVLFRFSIAAAAAA